MKIVTNGQFIGKRGRGIHIAMVLSGLRQRHGGISSIGLIHGTRYRVMWRVMDSYNTAHNDDGKNNPEETAREDKHSH